MRVETEIKPQMNNIKASSDGYLLYYRRPVQSRNKRLWLCYLTSEDRWALASSPYFPNSTDIGYRWVSRTEGVITLNMVSHFKYGSAQMIEGIKKCKTTMARISAQVAG